MTIEKVLRWVAIAGVFALPFVCLVVTTSLFFPYITGKNFAFRIIVEIMTAAWLGLAFLNSEYRPKRSLILAALTLFVLVIAIADAQGVYPFKSFWSNFERMDGWVTLAHVLAYVTVAASVMRSEKLWRNLFWTSLGVSVYVSLYSMLQIAGVTSLNQGGASGLSARVDATFGNPIYLAAYMLFHVFIAALLWSRSWVERKTGERLAPSLAYGAIIALDSLTLFFTGTRGTIIGLIGGALLTCLILVVLARNSRNVWRFSVGAVVGILVLVGGFWLIRDAAWIHEIGFLQRLATISTEDNTVKARFINWSIAMKGVEERPLLGWGQENFAIVFDKYYDPRMYAQEPWFDRVHNIVFDWLVAGGIVGLVSYLSVFAATLWMLWRSRAFTVAERAIFTGLLAGYFCHNFFVFDNITSYILFGTVLAYIMWRSSDALDSKTLFANFTVNRSYAPIVAGVVVVLAWGMAWGVNSKALAQNRTLLSALSQQSAGVDQNLTLFKQAIAYQSFGTQEAREQLAQGAAQLASANIAANTKQQLFETAVNEMMAQAKASPLDARFPLFLSIVFDAYGDHADAAVALQKAHELSPAKQSIYEQMAQNAIDRKATAEALDYAKTSYELDTSNTGGALAYAAIAIRAGNNALANQILAPFMSSGKAADQRVLAAYVATKQYSKAVPIWKAYIGANPRDTQAYFTLAALYYEMGDRQNAILTLESVIAADPSVAANAQSLIEQVRNGTAQLQ